MLLSDLKHASLSSGFVGPSHKPLFGSSNLFYSSPNSSFIFTPVFVHQCVNLSITQRQSVINWFVFFHIQSWLLSVSLSSAVIDGVCVCLSATSVEPPCWFLVAGYKKVRFAWPQSMTAEPNCLFLYYLRTEAHTLTPTSISGTLIEAQWSDT